MNYLRRIKNFVILLSVSAIIIPCFIKPAHAMDYLIGVKGGFFVWDPYLKRVGSSMFDDMENGTGNLYGPVFSILFTPDFSLSVSGLFGHQSAHWTTFDFTREGDPNIISGTYSMDVDRIDIDSALSYRLTENFKVFAGYKYQNFDLVIKSSEYGRDGTGLTNGQYTKTEIKMPFNGPALGIGFSAPITERFFFASNLSALYMWGKFKLDQDGFYYIPGNPAKQYSSGPGDTSGVTMRSRGINFEPTIGASMGEGMPIFTLGVRLQWTQTKFENAEKIMLDEKWANDYQYGLFISIVQPF